MSKSKFLSWFWVFFCINNLVSQNDSQQESPTDINNKNNYNGPNPSRYNRGNGNQSSHNNHNNNLSKNGNTNGSPHNNTNPRAPASSFQNNNRVNGNYEANSHNNWSNGPEPRANGYGPDYSQGVGNNAPSNTQGNNGQPYYRNPAAGAPSPANGPYAQQNSPMEANNFRPSSQHVNNGNVAQGNGFNNNMNNNSNISGTKSQSNGESYQGVPITRINRNNSTTPILPQHYSPSMASGVNPKTTQTNGVNETVDYNQNFTGSQSDGRAPSSMGENIHQDHSHGRSRNQGPSSSPLGQPSNPGDINPRPLAAAPSSINLIVQGPLSVPLGTSSEPPKHLSSMSNGDVAPSSPVGQQGNSGYTNSTDSQSNPVEFVQSQNNSSSMSHSHGPSPSPVGQQGNSRYNSTDSQSNPVESVQSQNNSSSMSHGHGPSSSPVGQQGNNGYNSGPMDAAPASSNSTAPNSSNNNSSVPLPTSNASENHSSSISHSDATPYSPEGSQVNPGYNSGPMDAAPASRNSTAPNSSNNNSSVPLATSNEPHHNSISHGHGPSFSPVGPQSNPGYNSGLGAAAPASSNSMAPNLSDNNSIFISNGQGPSSSPVGQQVNPGYNSGPVAVTPSNGPRNFPGQSSSVNSRPSNGNGPSYPSMPSSTGPVQGPYQGGRRPQDAIGNNGYQGNTNPSPMNPNNSNNRGINGPYSTPGPNNVPRGGMGPIGSVRPLGPMGGLNNNMNNPGPQLAGSSNGRGPLPHQPGDQSNILSRGTGPMAKPYNNTSPGVKPLDSRQAIKAPTVTPKASDSVNNNMGSAMAFDLESLMATPLPPEATDNKKKYIIGGLIGGVAIVGIYLIWSKFFDKDNDSSKDDDSTTSEQDDVD